MNKRARFTAENAQATFTSLKGLMSPLEQEQEIESSQTVEVELGRIRPNPDQPRRSESPGMSKASIEDLAENIREHGVLQPILVKTSGRFYQIVAGERRFRACQMLGLERVPVRIIEPKDDQEELQIALAENLQRKSLDVLEEARAFRILIHRFGLSYRDLAKLAGRSVAHVHGRLQLLDHDDVRAAVEEKRIGIADAIQLARVPDEASRKELLAAVQDGSMRGAALHRQVQVFLGELSPEAVEVDKTSSPAVQAEAGLDGAVSAVLALPDDISEDDRRKLTTLVTRAAELLGVHVASRGADLNAPSRDSTPSPEPPAAGAREQEQPRVPLPISSEHRRLISRTKEHRNARGYTVVNRVRVYWMGLERRGYSFTPGEWKVAPGGEGRYLVSFAYTLDDEPRAMEWWHKPDGSIEPANEDARAL